MARGNWEQKMGSDRGNDAWIRRGQELHRCCQLLLKSGAEGAESFWCLPQLLTKLALLLASKGSSGSVKVNVRLLQVPEVVWGGTNVKLWTENPSLLKLLTEDLLSPPSGDRPAGATLCLTFKRTQLPKSSSFQTNVIWNASKQLQRTSLTWILLLSWNRSTECL